MGGLGHGMVSIGLKSVSEVNKKDTSDSKGFKASLRKDDKRDQKWQGNREPNHSLDEPEIWEMRD